MRLSVILVAGASALLWKKDEAEGHAAIIDQTHVETHQKFEGPADVLEVADLAYHDDVTPKFVPLESTPNIAIANNDTASLKIIDLRIDPHPLGPGKIEFNLDYILTKEIPSDAEISILGWVGYRAAYNGTTALCPYMQYAKINCPVPPTSGQKSMKQVLKVPDDVNEGRFSFVSRVIAPSKDDSLIAEIAGVIDIEAGAPVHEEL